MPMLPFKNEPVAALHAICDWMALRERDQFAGGFSE